MSENLGCQPERRFRPLKPATGHEHFHPPTRTQRTTLRSFKVLTTHDGDVFCLEDGFDDSLPIVCWLRSRAQKRGEGRGRHVFLKWQEDGHGEHDGPRLDRERFADEKRIRRWVDSEDS